MISIIGDKLDRVEPALRGYITSNGNGSHGRRTVGVQKARKLYISVQGAANGQIRSCWLAT